jgi:transposase
MIEPAIVSAGANLMFLPPYSPDFSPIENLWSSLKLYLRSVEPRTYLDLQKHLEQGFAQVSSQNLHA